MSIVKRRRPRHHKRKVGDTYVEVNVGVEYSEQGSGEQNKREYLSGGVSQVASAPHYPSSHPVSEVVANVKTPKNGIFWKSEGPAFDPFMTFSCKREMEVTGDYATGTIRSAEGILPLLFRGEHLEVDEGAHLTRLFASNMDYRRANLRRLTLDPVKIYNCDFSGGMLDGADFSSEGWARRIERCSFVGTSCRDADFRGVLFARGNSFVGADLTGVSFAGSRIEGAGYYGPLSIEKGSIDFTDSNVTAEQIQQVVEMNSDCQRDFGQYIRYREYTFAEAASIAGVDVEDLATLVWASEIEVRDNEKKLCVDMSSLDAATQHIPQWAMRELLDLTGAP